MANCLFITFFQSFKGTFYTYKQTEAVFTVHSLYIERESEVRSKHISTLRPFSIKNKQANFVLRPICTIFARKSIKIIQI